MTIAILKANKGEPMIIGEKMGREPKVIGELDLKEVEGIYIEVDEKDVPKENRIDKKDLDRHATVNGSYLRSNTIGRTQGKYFKKVSDLPSYEPIYKDKLNEMYSLGDSWKKAYEILKEIDNNSLYELHFDATPCEDDRFYLRVIRSFKENEIKAEEHQFEEYEENFKGSYGFHMTMLFNGLNGKEIEEIKKLQLRETRYGEKIGVDLETLNSIVDNYNLEYHMPFAYSKYDFLNEGEHTKGINIYGDEVI